jgi:hypothetical protein
MSGKRITLLVAVALMAATALLGGCTKPVTQAPSTPQVAPSQPATVQVSVEPTTTIPIQTTGPITSPASGSTLRKELLDAARTKLGSSTQFYVYQIYVQGDTAIADLDPVSKDTNGRVFVAFEKRDGKWTAIGALKFGSVAANAATTSRALPSFSSELINKVNWTLKKPVVKAASTSAATLTKVTSSLAADAKTWSKTAMSGEGSPYKVTLIRVAKDSSGTWWGRVVTQPTGEYERLQFWAKYSGGAWSGTAQDPEPPAPSTYFPASVVSKLGF